MDAAWRARGLSWIIAPEMASNVPFELPGHVGTHNQLVTCYCTISHAYQYGFISSSQNAINEFDQ